MKRLIVNADDFGLTAGINRAVIKGHRYGIITSASLLANGPGFDDATRLAREHPSLGVGLHFNLTQGQPVAPVSRVRSLTNGRGEFWGTSAALTWRSLAGELQTGEIIIELRAQIERALAAGLRLTHIDSHKHAHALPQIFEAVIRTIPEYGIRAVRVMRERPRWRRSAASLKLLKQNVVAWGLAQLCRLDLMWWPNAGLRMTDAFFGIAQTGLWTKEWLVEIIEHLPEGVSELMCHPGYEDEEIRNLKTRLRSARAIELQLLTDREIVALLRERGVKLISYAQFDQV